MTITTAYTARRTVPSATFAERDTRLGWEFDLWGVAGDEVLFVQQRPHVATE